jgi:AraC-like DNA-binding protein
LILDDLSWKNHSRVRLLPTCLGSRPFLRARVSDRKVIHIVLQERECLSASSRFVRITRHDGARTVQNASLFSGSSPLTLHDLNRGSATVGRAVLGELFVGSVISTGHDVTVRESQALSLVLPVSGTMTTEVGGRTLKANAGQALLLPRGFRKSQVVGNGAVSYAAYVLRLRPEDLSSYRYVEESGGIVLEGSRVPDAENTLRTIHLLTELLESGARVLDRPGAARSWFDLIASSLDQCIEALHDVSARETSVGPNAVRYVNRAEDYMRWNLVDIATTTDVARKIGVSRRTLETAFQKVRSASPAKVLSGMRLEAARRLLLSPEGPSSVTDVCLDCGIGHHGRFSAVYRAEYGETPSETLRKRCS